MNSQKKKLSKITKQWIALAVATLALIAVAALPISEDLLTINEVPLPPEGRLPLGILLFCLILWMTEAIPFHITGLLGIVLIAVTKIDTFDNAVRVGFGNNVVCFFIGVLVLSANITTCGLGTRISVWLLSKTGNKTKTILLGFLIAGTLMAMWITGIAVAAMLMPLAKSILEDEGLVPHKSNFGRALMISCVWGPLIGGIGTPAGAGANTLGIGFAKEMANIEISFLQWMTYGVPCALLLIIPSWYVLRIVFPLEIVELKKSKEELQLAAKELPALSKDEKSIIVIFLLTVILWLTSSPLEKLLGIAIPVALPVTLTSLFIFFPGVTSIKWKDIEPQVSWSGIMLILTGVALGDVIYKSGAAEWMAMLLLGGMASLQPIPQIFLLVFCISILKIAFSSNTVTATIIVPLLIAMAQAYELPILPILIPACLSLSLAMILVTSAPTNIVPYSAGYFSIQDFAKAGVIMTLVYSAIFSITIYGIGQFTGLY